LGGITSPAEIDASAPANSITLANRLWGLTRSERLRGLHGRLTLLSATRHLSRHGLETFRFIDIGR
jgi:hypothetical protein